LLGRFGKIGVNGEGRDIVWQLVRQSLGAEPRADEHAPAAGMVGRLHIVDLIADERRLGRVCAI
jgi:hypothetical protein